MALRMNRSRLRALRALHEAGSDGVGNLSITDAPNLVAHLLAEEFMPALPGHPVPADLDRTEVRAFPIRRSD